MNDLPLPFPLSTAENRRGEPSCRRCDNADFKGADSDDPDDSATTCTRSCFSAPFVHRTTTSSDSGSLLGTSTGVFGTFDFVFLGFGLGLDGIENLGFIGQFCFGRSSSATG